LPRISRRQIRCGAMVDLVGLLPTLVGSILFTGVRFVVFGIGHHLINNEPKRAQLGPKGCSRNA